MNSTNNKGESNIIFQTETYPMKNNFEKEFNDYLYQEDISIEKRDKRLIINFIESLLEEQKKELIEEIKEELRTWINDNNVDFNGTDVTYTAELANYVDNKLKHND